MEYVMQADLEDGSSPTDEHPTVRFWHMVHVSEETALCGRELDPAAPKQSPDTWGTPESQPFCHTCGALYLRQVP
ncbi:hypothetical protein OG204_31540 [Streptomyces sp. NBC_01387]|uniref:hypothetical protein n=1 Tax=unclassified Streptomyces TaxID=2593676 RepID=UPI00202469BD|nr:MULTISPECIES: hypothetical protein [unclassified Streptomyces]MCX4553916.1 hypothetical protein [Streptomyces sp. NBC_01500]WSC18824.1 hypothetical protein OIE60_03665 [Streptomyces sp. NBC_01766]WSV52860.1 hypothetical protein OG282_03695 [Streptomyces sp. NBC_01014]